MPKLCFLVLCALETYKNGILVNVGSGDFLILFHVIFEISPFLKFVLIFDVPFTFNIILY